MSKFVNFAKDFMNDEEGLTIVEYLIGAALLVVAFLAADPWGSLSTFLQGKINAANSINS